VVLVSNEDWEFDVEALHHGCGFAPDSRLFTQSDLPVRQQTFDQEVETNQKVHQILMSSLTVLRRKCLIVGRGGNGLPREAPSEHGDFKDLTREFAEG